MIDELTRNIIRSLHAEGRGIREISRMLDISRPTVRRWLRQQDPAPRKLGETGEFLAARRGEMEALFVRCGQNCGAMQRAIRDEYGIEVPLRTLQRFCSPLRKASRK